MIEGPASPPPAATATTKRAARPSGDDTVAAAARIAASIDDLHRSLSDSAALATPTEVSTVVHTLGDAAEQLQQVLTRIGDQLDRLSEHPDLDMARADLAGHAVAASSARQIAQRLAGTYPGTATRRYGALLGQELHAIAKAVGQLHLRTTGRSRSGG